MDGMPNDCDHDPPTQPSYFQIIWRVLNYIVVRRQRIIAFYIIMLIEVLLHLALPFYLNSLIVQAIHSSGVYNESQMLQTLVALVVMEIITSVVTELREFFYFHCEDLIKMDFSTDLFRTFVESDTAEFDKYGKTVLLHAMNETESFSSFLAVNGLYLFRELVMVLVTIIVMYSLDRTLWIMTMLLVPIIIISRKIQYVQPEDWSNRPWHSYNNDKDHIEDVLNSIENVRSFGCEREEVRTLQKLMEVGRNHRISQTPRNNLKVFEYINEYLRKTVDYMTLFYGGYLVQQGLMTPENVLIFRSYQEMFTGSVLPMQWRVNSTKNFMLSARRVFGFMDIKSKLKRNGVERPVVRGEIKLNAVDFTYESKPDKQVLKKFNLHIKAGESVALVGPSGSGKSTVFNLIERFYDPTNGSITLDDIPIEEIDKEYYHKQIALVVQNPVLYNRSIRENILYGCNWATEEDMVEASKLANAHAFVAELKEGYDTPCGRSGNAFSDGQIQRIAIARALVRQPAVLLFDEATSALDKESECAVQEALKRCCKDRTVIVIAHRLSTIQSVEKIAIVKEGQIIEFGTHHDLMSIKDGTYASLIQLQMSGFTGNSVAEAFDKINTWKGP